VERPGRAEELGSIETTPARIKASGGAVIGTFQGGGLLVAESSATQQAGSTCNVVTSSTLVLWITSPPTVLIERRQPVVRAGAVGPQGWRPAMLKE
jgi:hypothetical protein